MDLAEIGQLSSEAGREAQQRGRERVARVALIVRVTNDAVGKPVCLRCVDLEPGDINVLTTHLDVVVALEPGQIAANLPVRIVPNAVAEVANASRTGRGDP